MREEQDKVFTLINSFHVYSVVCVSMWIEGSPALLIGRNILSRDSYIKSLFSILKVLIFKAAKYAQKKLDSTHARHSHWILIS